MNSERQRSQRNRCARQVAQGRRIGQVGGGGHGVTAQRPNLLGDTLGFFGGTVVMDHDVIAGARGLKRQHPADPTSCSGDQGALAARRR
jgi:hypothetical protein